jgi:prepilin-type N-terminal cleavage/methylation domain-containing protein
MENNTQDKGFTLVELLIVIVILGILATVTVFAVRGITDKGQESACAADKKTMQVAVEAFYAQNGTTLGDASEAKLLTAGLIVEASGNVDIRDAATISDATTQADGDVELFWQVQTDQPCGTGAV